jgi:probable rRNA maturation factor
VRPVRDVAVGGRRLALPAATVRRVARGVLASERSDADVSITFLGPATMRRLNRRYNGREEPTDVIAFTLETADHRTVGDVYLCQAVAARQARRHGVSRRQELIRLVVHGVLHVLGHDHPEGDGRVRSAMWRRQERYVERFT